MVNAGFGIFMLNTRYMILKFKPFVFAFIALFFTVKAISQSDHLYPARSYFTSYDYDDEYFSNCRKVLYKNLEKYYVARIIIFPSSDYECLFTVDIINKKYVLKLRQLSSRIWRTDSVNNIFVIDKTFPVDSIFASTLHSVFVKLINKCSYEHPGGGCEVDGNMYQFIARVGSDGFGPTISGVTYDCAEGKQMQTLIAFVQQLKKSCENNSFAKDRDLLMEKCRFIMAN